MNSLFFPVNPGALTATSLIVMGLASGLSSTANAALRTWDGGGANNNWSTAANWGGTALVVGDSMTFAGTTRLAPQNDFTAGSSFAGIAFVNGAGAFTLSGTGVGLNEIALTGSVVNSSANLQTITLPISLAAVLTFNTGVGGLMIGATDDSASGVISGAGGITKIGSGTLTLNAANTYSGGTTISGGTLSISSASNLGSGSLMFAGASSTLYAAVDGINLGMTIDQTAGPSNFNVDSGDTLTISGTISGASQLRMNGSGTLVLNAANSYSGKTVVNSGTLRLGALGSILATNFDVFGATFDLNGQNQNVSTTMTLGTATSDGVILSSSSASTLTVGSSVAAGSGLISVNLAGAGGVTKTTARTVTLSGANTYTGPTLVQAGNLLVNGDHTLATGAANVDANAGLGGDGIIGAASYDDGAKFPWTVADWSAAPSLTAGAVTIDGALTVVVDDAVSVANFTEATTSFTILSASSLTVVNPAALTVDATAFTTGTGAWSVEKDGDTLKLVYTPAPVGYTVWANAYAPGQAADLDHDNDGVSNGVEYFMGETGSTFTANPGVIGDKVTWPKDSAFIGTFKVQISDTLAPGGWTDITPPDPSIDETNSNQVVFTLPTGAPKKFARLNVVVP